MQVVFLIDHDDGHKAGKAYSIDITLGRRLCNNGVCIPYVTWVEQQKVERAAMAEAKRVAAIKKKALLKKKSKHKTALAVSMKAAMREKQVKK